MTQDSSRSEYEIDLDRVESLEWLESLDYVLQTSGPGRVRQLIAQLQAHARGKGVRLPFAENTPYINTIPPDQQPPYPGSDELEHRIRNIIRWNAMAMVVRANTADKSLGGHIATYASVCNLYEVGFNHFFRGRATGTTATRSSSSPILRRASTPGRLSRGGSTSSTWTTSGGNCARAAACRPIPIRGSCPISGCFPRLPWD